MATITGTTNGDPEREGTKLADRVVWRRGAVQTIKRQSPSQRCAGDRPRPDRVQGLDLCRPDAA